MILYDELPVIEREILRVLFHSTNNSLTVSEILQQVSYSNYKVFVAINYLLEEGLLIPYSSTENSEESRSLNPSFYPIAELMHQMELKGEKLDAEARPRMMNLKQETDDLQKGTSEQD
ncbi:MAG: hypothetical protein LH606_18770 [Cytophagaceae bacterium]|nr:hypothetical protein [Cytophagaceae bacterium]